MAPSKQIFLQYQREWIDDKSPLKIWKKARQIGFSFCATFRAVTDLVRHKTLWIALSAGQRQSNELAQKAREHVEAISKIEQAARGFEFREDERTGVFEEHTRPDGIVVGVELTQSVIHFPSNKSRMIFLPANPDTARGYTGNVLADEFAFHKDAKRIYAAIYPSITRGYSIEIGSTCFGESGMFYELCEKKNGFSKHSTTIYDAVAQGLQADIEKLREGCPDEEIWEQEYCCKFISDASSWITWDQIIAAESGFASIDLPLGFIPIGELYLGVDIGRKKDLTVIYLLEKVLGVFWTRAVLRLRNTPFAVQRQQIDWFFENLPVRRGCFDSTGIGMQMAEEVQAKFGSYRIEPVTFTAPVKEDLAVRTRRAYEDMTIRIPDERGLRNAIHAVRRFPTTAGNFRFDADRTEAGHADEFWAQSLALLAGSSGADAAMSSSDVQVGGREQGFGRGDVMTGVSRGGEDFVRRDRRSRWA
jgi:phage FluMu gp28-like protein